MSSYLADSYLLRGLHLNEGWIATGHRRPGNEMLRRLSFHKATVHAFADMLGAMG
jgi:hypothetical protein